jgi:hypothetical protein
MESASTTHTTVVPGATVSDRGSNSKPDVIRTVADIAGVVQTTVTRATPSVTASRRGRRLEP